MSSTSRGREERLLFEWTLEDCLFFEDNHHQNQTRKTSAPQPYQSVGFNLQFLRKGPKLILSLYLLEPIDVPIKGNFKLGLVDDKDMLLDENCCHIIERIEEIYDQSHGILGITWTLSRTLLFNSSRGLLTEGTLKVRCEVTLSCGEQRAAQAVKESTDFEEKEQLVKDSTDIEVAAFLSTGKLDIKACSLDLLAAAARCGAIRLKHICEKQVAAKLTSETVVKTLIEANKWEANNLFKACIDFITVNMNLLKEQKEWKEMGLHPHLMLAVFDSVTKK